MTKSEIVERVNYAFNTLLEARDCLRAEILKQHDDPQKNQVSRVARALARIYDIEDVLNPIVELENK